jgi:hypothetical protein
VRAVVLATLALAACSTSDTGPGMDDLAIAMDAASPPPADLAAPPDLAAPAGLDLAAPDRGVIDASPDGAPSFFSFSGVRTDLLAAQLAGWSLCYSDTYATSDVSLITTIFAQCDQANLLLACRQTGQSSLLVAAHAPRTDVLYLTGTGNTPHDANGVGWYYDANWSWGFAPSGDAVSRDSCDTSSTDGASRLCWSTGSGLLTAGWRCGTSQGLATSTAYERLVYQAP